MIQILNLKKYIFLSPSAVPEGVHKIGGGSTQWRGRISEFLPEDFYKTYSGQEFHWPFDKTELDRHYKKLYKFKIFIIVFSSYFHILKSFSNISF